jgi:hypothetical protein
MLEVHWANELAYYRSRFAAEYALGNKVSHARNVFVRERDVLPALDERLAGQFAPDQIEVIVADLVGFQDGPGAQQHVIAEAEEIVPHTPVPASPRLGRQRLVTRPTATSIRRFVATASSIRRSWVTSSRVPG